MTTVTIRSRRIRRHTRVRGRIWGTKERPRLSVFRSNKYLYAQLVNDVAARTILGMSDRAVAKKKMTKTDRARALGEALAKAAGGLGVKTVVFDRGSNRYHGRVQAFADGARTEGLHF